MTHQLDRSRSPCPSAGSASATRRTSPPASPRRSTTSTGTWWRGATRPGSCTCRTPFCPHLGAHLGHGGTVDGCEIVCPFHGWKFDAEGVNTDIPYSERINKKGTLRTYPGRRAQRRVAWSGTTPTPTVEPQWEIPELPEFNGDPEWSHGDPHRAHVDAPWQEMAENGVDSAHFRYVHNTAEVPVMESYETGFPGTQMRS